ncbi:MAG TPA: DUF2203 family protein [Acidiferrobacteraceae bacterium]|nr:DUF2203 family protein [Acidiferrobacteraceae bacterium]
MNSIPQIVSHEEPRVFNLAEAQELFSLVRNISQTAFEELVPIRKQLETMIPSNPQLPAMERRYEAIVKRWVSKMERLGLLVKGLWVVNFDTGDGYLCWKYPELKLSHYHDYSQSFSDRRPLEEIIEELDPDWA